MSKSYADAVTTGNPDHYVLVSRFSGGDRSEGRGITGVTRKMRKVRKDEVRATDRGQDRQCRVFSGSHELPLRNVSPCHAHSANLSPIFLRRHPPGVLLLAK